MGFFTSASPFFTFLVISVILIPAVSAEKYQAWFYWYNRPDKPTLSILESDTCSEFFSDYRNAHKNGKLHGMSWVHCIIVIFVS